jgi:hypothetical protein
MAPCLKMLLLSLEFPELNGLPVVHEVKSMHTKMSVESFLIKGKSNDTYWPVLPNIPRFIKGALGCKYVCVGQHAGTYILHRNRVKKERMQADKFAVGAGTASVHAQNRVSLICLLLCCVMLCTCNTRSGVRHQSVHNQSPPHDCHAAWPSSVRCRRL